MIEMLKTVHVPNQGLFEAGKTYASDAIGLQLVERGQAKAVKPTLKPKAKPAVKTEAETEQ